MKKITFLLFGFIFTCLFSLLLSGCGTDDDWTIPGQQTSELIVELITATQPELATTEPEPISQPSVGYATIQGYIGYPSEGWCPEMTLYARSSTGEQSTYSWNDGQCYFSFTVQAPATYILFAWPIGEYSDFGFMVTDDNYSAKEITVSVDEVVSGITLIWCETAYVPTP